MVENQIKITTFKEVLSLIGEYGPFQWILNVIFIAMHMAICVHLVLPSLSSLPPPWLCARNSSICTQNGTFAGNNLLRCNYSRSDWHYVGGDDFSLVSTFNLDCDREWLAHFLSSTLFLAWAIGSLFFGWISDNYGRKQILFISTGMIIVAGFASSFSRSLSLYIGCRFVIGFFYAGSALQTVVILSEVVGIRFRPFAIMMIWLSNLFGYIIVALESYLIENWRWLHILSTLPYIVVFLFYKFTPESIEWQYENGKIEELKSTMKRIAYWNKKEVSVKEINFVIPDKVRRRPNPIDLFRTKRIAFLTLAQGSMWFFSAIGYYGSLLSVSNLGGSVYMNFILLNFGSTLAYFIAPYFCTRFGRRKSITGFHLIAGVLCILNGFISLQLVTLRVAVGILGMNFVTMGLNSLYLWSGEIYPTEIRTEGLGFAEICCRVGSALSPFVGNYLRHFGSWVPYIAMGSFLILSALSGLPLPETKNGGNDFTKRDRSKSKTSRLNSGSGVRNDVFSLHDV